MTHSSSKKSPQHSQQGVTLMLAVLVLAAITAVAFSLATIVFIEIRSAGDAARTEPALYATLGVTEEALFQYKRTYDSSSALDVPNCAPSGQNVCSLNGVTLTLPGTQPIAFDNSPREEFIARGVTKVFPMYVVNDYSSQIYSSLKVEVLNNSATQGVNISSNLYKIDQINPTTPWSGQASPGLPFTTTTFTPPGQYELVITNPPSSSQDVTVSITTTRLGGVEPAGLPFVGEQVLRIMASYVGLTRTYQVRIPIP